MPAPPPSTTAPNVVTAATSKDFPVGRVLALANDIWWTWNPVGKRVFEALDPALWRAMNNSPMKTLLHMSQERMAALAADANFHKLLEAAEAEHAKYHTAKPWYAKAAGKNTKKKRTRVAYFCMEYGLHESLPLYSGGLGILAADHLKSASDLGVPLIAVGMLWRFGYYRQDIEADGTTRVVYEKYDFDELPITDTKVTVSVPIGFKQGKQHNVKAKVWKLQVGRVPLYLLDTDLPANSAKDRQLTHHLYGGDNDMRIRQEILLGIGGLLALQKLGEKVNVYHMNEGHAAFAALERVAQLMKAGKSFEAAKKAVRNSSVFTTHTPVPAGNDRFDAKLFNKYMKGYEKKLKISNHELLALGREDENDTSEQFCMTVLALKLAEHCNGVAKLHGETSRAMWTKTYNAATPDDVPIGHVTNGIHPESWISDDARPFYDQYLKPKWIGAGPQNDWWKNVSKVPAKELWALRQRLRRKFITELRQRMREQYQLHGAPPAAITNLYEQLDENALTIGFARRFATYKRATLLFRDEARLARLLNNAKKPVQIVFAGKAHPKDLDGQDFVRKVHKFTQKAAFKGKVFFVHNYDHAVGRMLTSGVDVWLNNPVRPMEASGTSGMKPPLNGGLNCSVLDGWWPEGYDERATKKNGWAIGGDQFDSRRAQDAFDAKAMYDVLEKEVVPTFYERGRDGVPKQWVKMMANSMASICCEFSTHRMLSDYCDRAYWPAAGV